MILEAKLLRNTTTLPRSYLPLKIQSKHHFSEVEVPDGPESWGSQLLWSQPQETRATFAFPALGQPFLLRGKRRRGRGRICLFHCWTPKTPTEGQPEHLPVKRVQHLGFQVPVWLRGGPGT